MQSASQRTGDDSIHARAGDFVRRSAAHHATTTTVPPELAALLTRVLYTHSGVFIGRVSAGMGGYASRSAQRAS